MGAASEIAKRMLRALSKGASEVADTELSQVLKSQVAEVARASGRKMSPEQSIKAMDTILELAPNDFSRSIRQDLINDLKSSGILEHKNTERVYAVGSSTTGKEAPSDLDLLVRSTSRVPRNYAKMVQDRPIDDRGALDLDEFSGLQVIWPHGSTISNHGGNVLSMTKKTMNTEIGDQAYGMATVGQGKYGKGHRWIRLLSGIPAIPGGGWPPYEEQE